MALFISDEILLEITVSLLIFSSEVASDSLMAGSEFTTKLFHQLENAPFA